MPNARYEQIVFGGTRNLEGQSLSVINEVIESGQVVPNSVSSILFPPRAAAAIVVVSAIGASLYALAGLSPTAESSRAKWIPNGGFAIFHVPAGHAIAVATADLN